MKRFLRFQLIFLPTLLRRNFGLALAAFFGQMAFIYLATSAGMRVRDMFATLAFITLLAGASASIIFYNQVTKNNLSWLMLLPLRKRALLLHFGFLRFCLMTAPYLTVFSMLAFLTILTGHWSGLLRFMSFLNPIDIWQEVQADRWELTAWLFVIFAFNIILGACLGWIDNWKCLPSMYWRSQIAKSTNLSTAGWILASVLLCFFTFHLNFIVTALLTMSLPLLLPFSWKEEFGFSRTAYRKSISFAILVCGLEVSILSGKVAAMYFGSAGEQIEVVRTFDGILPVKRAQSLAFLLEKELDTQETRIIAQRFLKTYHQGKPLNRRHDGLRFKAAFGTKTTVSAASEICRLYDPASLHLEDVRFILSALRKNKNDSWYFSETCLKDLTLSEEEMTTLFRTGSRLEIEFAISRARIDKKPRYAIEILDHLHLWHPSLIQEAIKTVSVIFGKEISTEDWLRYRRGGKLHLSAEETPDITSIALNPKTFAE